MKIDLLGMRITIRRQPPKRRKAPTGRPIGRPRHEPTYATRARVREMAAQGLYQADIAAEIGISAPTLCRHYQAELDASPQIIGGQND